MWWKGWRMTMRDKLIELLENLEQEKALLPDERAADFLIANGVTFAEDNNAPTKWIPVSERLPKESGRYWVWLKFHVRDRVIECPDVQRFVAELNAFMTDGIQSIDVTHWMPIVPPKEGE